MAQGFGDMAQVPGTGLKDQGPDLSTEDTAQVLRTWLKYWDQGSVLGTGLKYWDQGSRTEDMA
jgi:hypothetical protein